MRGRLQPNLMIRYSISVFCAAIVLAFGPVSEVVGATSDAGFQRPVKDKWALVVGISKFANPSLNLKYPSKDALDLRDFLVKEANFAPDHVRVLTDESATRTRILSELGDKWLPFVARPDDLVVVFISTHGSPESLDVAGVNYLLAHDTDLDSLYATGIPLQDLMHMVKTRIHSDRVLLVLDACHSGAAGVDAKGMRRVGNVNADAIAQGTGQLVITSSKPNQVSWESKQASNSVFTRHLISALRSNGQSTTLGAAFQRLREGVETEVLRDRGILQTPELKMNWHGADLILAAKPTSPRRDIAPPVETPIQASNPSASEASRSEPAQPAKGQMNPLLVTPPVDLLTSGLADVELSTYDKNFRKAERLIAEVLQRKLSPAEKVCALNSSGDVAYAQRKYTEALKAYSEALSVADRDLGPEHPFTAQSLDRITNVYWSQSKYSAGEPFLQRLIRIMQTTLGDHKDVIDKLGLLQFFYEQQGKTAEAAQIDRSIAEMKLRIIPKN